MASLYLHYTKETESVFVHVFRVGQEVFILHELTQLSGSPGIPIQHSLCDSICHLLQKLPILSKYGVIGQNTS